MTIDNDTLIRLRTEGVCYVGVQTKETGDLYLATLADFNSALCAITKSGAAPYSYLPLDRLMISLRWVRSMKAAAKRKAAAWESLTSSRSAVNASRRRGTFLRPLAVVIWTAAILRPMLETQSQAAQLNVGNALAWFAVDLASILSQHYLLGLIEKETRHEFTLAVLICAFIACGVIGGIIVERKGRNK